MTRRLAAAVFVAALCARAFAVDEPRERLHEALQALSADDAPRAVEILTAVAAEAPGDATVQFGLGVALSRVGRRDDARAAYERALAAPGGGEAAARALYNLGTSHLADAFAAAQTLREQDVAANVEPQARMMTAQKGVESARAAIRALRDRVRSEPTDKAAAHNLQVAQRTRRFLEEELSRQQQQQSGEQGDTGEKNEQGKEKEAKDGEQEQPGDDAQQSPQPDDGEQGEQPPDKSEKGSQGDEQEDQEKPPSGSQDSGATGDENQPPPDQGAAGKGDEAKDDPLHDLLEAAARRLRVVEEMRKSKMRRVRVEKDW